MTVNTVIGAYRQADLEAIEDQDLRDVRDWVGQEVTREEERASEGLPLTDPAGTPQALAPSRASRAPPTGHRHSGNTATP